MVGFCDIFSGFDAVRVWGYITERSCKDWKGRLVLFVLGRSRFQGNQNSKP